MLAVQCKQFICMHNVLNILNIVFWTLYKKKKDLALIRLNAAPTKYCENWRRR